MKFYTIISFLLMSFSSFYGQNNNLAALLKQSNPTIVFSSESMKQCDFAETAMNGTPAKYEFKANKNNFIGLTEVFKASASHYAVVSKYLGTKPVKKGDVLLAKFNLRSLSVESETKESTVYFYVKRKAVDFPKSIIAPFSFGSEQKTIYIPFIAAEDMNAGECEISFTFGQYKQKVEVSNIMLYNFQNKVTIDKLPQTPFTYPGRQPDAAWRKEALKRIEDIRTGPININVVDSYKRPISDAKVDVKMTKSDFIWGTAAEINLLTGTDVDSQKYKDILKTYFNTVLIDGGFKGEGWNSSQKDLEKTLKAFDWAQANGFRQRAKSLVWPSWKFTSAAVKELAINDSDGFEQHIQNQIEDKVSFLKGRVISWEVLDQSMFERDYFQHLPKDIEVKWFRMAKELDPEAALFVNDYGMLNSLSSVQNINRYIKMITGLISKGALIEGIGIEGHIGAQPRGPEQVISDLKLFEPVGLPVQITEFDINTKDTQLQADYFRDFLIACYSSSVVNGFTIWGFWEKVQWKKDAALFKTDWSEKPNLKIWKDLVNKQWKTSFTQNTGKEGIVSSRGHFGDYEITVTKGNIVKKATVNVSKDNSDFEIVFK